MKTLIVALTALTLIGGAATAQAQDSTTVIHKQSSDGDSSKTVVKHDDGAKTVIKHHGNKTKKVHTDANGDKTVVKKTTEQ
jgi:hypothetical protein